MHSVDITEKMLLFSVDDLVHIIHYTTLFKEKTFVYRSARVP